MGKASKKKPKAEAADPALATERRLARAAGHGKDLDAAVERLDLGWVRHRGGEVSRLRRVRGRDGLVFEWERERLVVGTGPDGVATARDHERAKVLVFAGLAYREMVEAAGAGALRSQLEDRVSAGNSGTSDGIVWGALDRAHMAVMLGDVERAVVAAFPYGRELGLLRQVAGLGASLRSCCGGGEEMDRARASLIAVLGLVATLLRIPGAEPPKRVGKAGPQQPVVSDLQGALLAAEVEPWAPVDAPEGEALQAHVRGRLLASG